MKLRTFIVLLASSGMSEPMFGQSFSSGSTGADGPLNITAPGVTIFDPKTFNPPLNPAGDNIFNFYDCVHWL